MTNKTSQTPNHAVMVGETTLTKTAHVSDGTGDMWNGARRFAGSLGGRAVSYKGYQYVVYYQGKDRSKIKAEQYADVVVARRKLESDDWRYAKLQGYRLTSEDAHNRPSIAISEGDGVIHISFDHHNSKQLHYAMSAPGVASSPGSIVWDDTVFTYTPNLGLAEVELGIVTYPSLHSIEGGNLMLYYRDGLSYGGDMRLAFYDGTSSQWQWVRELSSRHGSYLGVKDVRGPYLSGGIKISPSKTLVMSWLWRETSLGCADIRERVDEKMCNQGLYFAKSDDFGVTWQTAAGKSIANLLEDKPISIDTIGGPLIPLPHTARPSNVLNTSVIDPHTEQYHVFISHLAPPYDDLDNRNVYHYQIEDDGTWRGESTTFAATNVDLAFAGDMLYAFVGRHSAAIYAARRDEKFKIWREIPIPMNNLSQPIEEGYISWDLSDLPDGHVSAIWHQPSSNLDIGEPAPIVVVDLQVEHP